jgi:modulator of FtsH protease HflK
LAGERGGGPAGPLTVQTERRAAFEPADIVRVCFGAAFIAVLLLGTGWGISNIRQVPPESRAVVQRFGQIDRVQNAGLMLAWPQPIEQITLVPAWDHQIPMKIASPPNAGPSAETDFQVRQPDDVVSMRKQRDAWNGQYFLTGDDSVVQYDATLYYHVTDPAAYVLSKDHVEPALQRLFRTASVTIAASHALDDFLVARPEEATQAAAAGNAGRRMATGKAMLSTINQSLAQLKDQGADLGVEITRVDVVALLPPLAKSAFDDVLTASQMADQTEAAARTDAARTTQEAQRAYDRTRSEATAAAQELSSLAHEQVADVEVLHTKMTPTNRESLLAQYYRDRIGAVLGKIGQVTTVDMRGRAPIIIQGPQ